MSQQVCTLSLQKALQSKTNFHQGKHQTRQATESCFGIGSQFSSVTHSFFNHVHIHAHGFFGYLIGSTEQNDALLSCLAGVESLALVVLRVFRRFTIGFYKPCHHIKFGKRHIRVFLKQVECPNWVASVTSWKEKLHFPATLRSYIFSSVRTTAQPLHPCCAAVSGMLSCAEP